VAAVMLDVGINPVKIPGFSPPTVSPSNGGGHP
jgi:hypothetical protein